MGRRTKYTPERVSKLIRALKAGKPRYAACAVSGISCDTLANWLADNSEFSEMVRAAEDFAEAKYAAIIEKAATGWNEITVREVVTVTGAVETTTTKVRKFDVGAAKFWLERRRPQNWRNNLDITSGGEPVQKAVIGFDPSEV